MAQPACIQIPFISPIHIDFTLQHVVPVQLSKPGQVIGIGLLYLALTCLG